LDSADNVSGDAHAEHVNVFAFVGLPSQTADFSVLAFGSVAVWDWIDRPALPPNSERDPQASGPSAVFVIVILFAPWHAFLSSVCEG
jgi:hypothetical protein